MTGMVARLRQLEAAATPGPWVASKTTDGHAVVGLRQPPVFRVLLETAPSGRPDTECAAAARNALPQLLDGMDILVQMVKTRDEYDEAFQTRDWQTCERIEYESEHDDLHQRAKSLLAALDSQETE